MEGRIENVDIGLPEFDDRLDLWRISLLATHNGREPVAELRVAEATGEVVFSTNLALVAERAERAGADRGGRTASSIAFSPLESRIALGDAVDVLGDYPRDSVQMVFTSPPYFNAKPECHESVGYAEYLDLLQAVFDKCHAVLSEGRFLIVNTSPVLIRRAHRQASSRRVPITFDIHRLLDDIGFDFIDDIIWQKPEGAGWHLGRGRRFAADRQPLQYKAVTVTENVTVYRKRTDKLIDWNIRHHPDQDAAERSRIADGYERTNIWRIRPASHKRHPAVFPDALAERVIRYYSFRGDMVLDPFAGTGTTGRVAHALGRRFTLIEKSPDYFDALRADLQAIPAIVSYDHAASAL
ncbi:MAG: site-specific DNA-methyltransferase [Gammaproteobacteria bacterium]|nr:site-specific DNA-methyltransferase [Gammaproteobacteria bacterium]